MILDEICAHKRKEVDARKAAVSRQELEERVGEVRPARPFRDALRKEGISLIAEIKRASPSKGDLLKDADALNLAALYEQAGARAISVLTDAKYFKGSLQDLTSVRNSVSVPCLRKDFIVDEYQIWESRAAHADAILLIVRCLSDQQIRDYTETAEGLGMGVLVESHDAHEIERAIASGAHIIGINNRDLATFEVDVQTSLQLKRLVPGGHVLVSESGIHTRAHVRMLEDGGVDAILVGESLVTSNNIAGKIRELLHDDES
jgi:indole-3-glycerol phosphate synthase